MNGPNSILLNPTTKKNKAGKTVSWDPSVSPPQPSRTCVDCGHRSFRKPRRRFYYCEQCFSPLCKECVNGKALCTACFFEEFDTDKTYAVFDYNKQLMIYC